MNESPGNEAVLEFQAAREAHRDGLLPFAAFRVRRSPWISAGPRVGPPWIWAEGVLVAAVGMPGSCATSPGTVRAAGQSGTDQLGAAAFSQTDFTEHLRKITVPVLVMHGDDASSPTPTPDHYPRSLCRTER
jgi:pimeloyl-ACP methyl ester carboxylesterase